MEKTADILRGRQMNRANNDDNTTVNCSSVLSSSVSPVNSIRTNKEKVKIRHAGGMELKLRDKISLILKEFPQEIDYYAKQLALGLDDIASLNYYRFLVRNNDPALLIECLGITKENAKDGLVRGPVKIYFPGVVRNKGGITSKKDIHKMKYGI